MRSLGSEQQYSMTALAPEGHAPGANRMSGGEWLHSEVEAFL